MTTIRRLLKSLHQAVFDRSPRSRLAMRVRHPTQDMTWVVSEDVLTITTGSTVRSYELLPRTIAQLAQTLRVDGFEVDYVSPSLKTLSAAVLVDGAGNQDEPNGDNLLGFTSLTWVLFTAFARELRAAKQQIPEALKQMVIPTASGEWLDLFGKLYSAPRAQNENDASFAVRIPKEAFRERVNAFAIENAILDLTGKDVRIEEPWTLMFRLDESALSGRSRFYDGGTVGYHLLQPVSYEAINWAEVLRIIDRNRAAGVIVLPPEVRLRAQVSANVLGAISGAHTAIRSETIEVWEANRLSQMSLSGEVIARTFAARTDERFFVPDPLTYPTEILAEQDGTDGYTWRDYGVWPDAPWGSSP